MTEAPAWLHGSNAAPSLDFTLTPTGDNSGQCYPATNMKARAAIMVLTVVSAWTTGLPGSGFALGGFSSGDTPEPHRLDDDMRTSTLIQYTTPAYDAQTKVLGEFVDRHGFKRRYLKIAKGLDDAQVIDLAKRLHSREKDVWYWLLDDDSQAGQMMKTLPKTAEGELAGYPADWVRKHTVAHVVLQMMPNQGGYRWVLLKGHGATDVMAVLSGPTPSPH